MTDLEDRPGIESDPVEQDTDWADYRDEVEVSAFDRMMDFHEEPGLPAARINHVYQERGLGNSVRTGKP